MKGAATRSHFALLLIDVINPLDFPEAPQIEGLLPRLTRTLLRLQERARKARVPIIYVNDNFGRWRSDFREQVKYCLHQDSRGCEMVTRLQPGEEDYFILKPKHSGFFGTPLDILLDSLGARRLILTGIAGSSCVLATASDAYMRDYELFVPRDGTISNTGRENQNALKIMRDYLKADTRPAAKIIFRQAARPLRNKKTKLTR
jgi:nicotinamidase-related amidase